MKRYGPEDVAESRLQDWADELHYPGFSAWPSQNMLERLRTDRRNAAPGVQPGDYEIIDPEEDEGGPSVAVVKDGGVGAMVDRMHKSIKKANDCEEVQRAVERMPDYYQTFLRATYVRYSPREDHVTAEEAAKRLGVAERTYYRDKRRVLLYIACQLCLPGAPEAEAARLREEMEETAGRRPLAAA